MAKLVTIFREARRVLRDDGSMWLNLGPTYMNKSGNGRGGGSALSGGKPHLSGVPRVPVYGNSDRGSQDCRGDDLSLSNPSGVNPTTSGHHTAHTDGGPSVLSDGDATAQNLVRTDCPDSFLGSLDSTLQRLTVRLNHATLELWRSDDPWHEPLRALLLSMTCEFSRRLHGDSLRARILSALACQLTPRSFFADVLQCEHTQQNIADMKLIFGLWADRIQGRELSCMAYPHYATNIPPLKIKDLIDIPHYVVQALIADGWYLRARCPWVKRNGMPESCTDRPTTTVEDFFLLTKSDSYFYDPEAVRKVGTIRAGTRGAKGSAERAAVNGVNARPPEYKVYDGTRLRRSSDWFFESVRGLIGDDDGNPLAFMVNTKPFKGAHFATFPPELITPCILSGTSEKGCCSRCGKPFTRIVEKTDIPDASYKGSRFDAGKTGARDGGYRTQPGDRFLKQTTGWEQNCMCAAGLSPCVVLDPFGGSGTVGEVCATTGRDAILIEVNPEYQPLMEERVSSIRQFDDP